MDITNLNVTDWSERRIEVNAAAGPSYELRIVLDCHEPGLQGRVILRGEDILIGLCHALRDFRRLSNQEIAQHIDEGRRLRMPRTDVLDDLVDAVLVLKDGQSRLDRIEEQQKVLVNGATSPNPSG